MLFFKTKSPHVNYDEPIDWNNLLQTMEWAVRYGKKHFKSDATHSAIVYSFNEKWSHREYRLSVDHPKVTPEECTLDFSIIENPTNSKNTYRSEFLVQHHNGRLTYGQKNPQAKLPYNIFAEYYNNALTQLYIWADIMPGNYIEAVKDGSAWGSCRNKETTRDLLQNMIQIQYDGNFPSVEIFPHCGDVSFREKSGKYCEVRIACNGVIPEDKPLLPILEGTPDDARVLTHQEKDVILRRFGLELPDLWNILKIHNIREQ